MSQDKKNGAFLILEERLRQLDHFGFDRKHDDTLNGQDELAWAAIAYAAPETVYRMRETKKERIFEDPWPWDGRFDARLHDSRVTRLIKAGALIAAEIDRLLFDEEMNKKQTVSSGTFTPEEE